MQFKLLFSAVLQPQGSGGTRKHTAIPRRPRRNCIDRYQQVNLPRPNARQLHAHFRQKPQWTAAWTAYVWKGIMQAQTWSPDHTHPRRCTYEYDFTYFKYNLFTYYPHRRLWRNRWSPWQRRITTSRFRSVWTCCGRSSHFALKVTDANNNFSLPASLDIRQVCTHTRENFSSCFVAIFRRFVAPFLCKLRPVKMSVRGSDVTNDLF